MNDGITFTSWPPPLSNITHGQPAPIGSVRVGVSGKSRHREIKIRMDGPVGHRWMNLARYWWLRFRGPIPEGKRIGHVDGDCMNDDPANYAIFTPGDTFAVWEDVASPSRLRAARKRISTGTANILRAQIRRSIGFLPTRWYAVDFERGIIFNAPHRKRWMAYAAHGLGIRPTANDAGVDAAVLGWPGVPRLGAFVLMSLCAGSQTSDGLWIHVSLLIERYRSRRPRHRAAMHLVMVELRRRGLIESLNRGRLGSFHQITQAGRAARGPACPVIAVRGSELDEEAFRKFLKVDPITEECAA